MAAACLFTVMLAENGGTISFLVADTRSVQLCWLGDGVFSL